MIRGKYPLSVLFKCIAHRRVPSCNFHLVPRAEWDAAAVAGIKKILGEYKLVRTFMKRRTVLGDDAGVLWEGEGGKKILFSFRRQAIMPGRWYALDGGNEAGEFAADSVYADFII